MKIIPLLKVARPWNSLIVFASVFLGAVFAGVISPLAPVMLACFSAALIASGGYSINDYFDYKTDTINRPERPIPRKEMKRNEALLLSILLTVAGVIVACLISRSLGSVAVCAAIVLFLYSYVLKRVALAGNLVVSFLCGLVFLFGGLSVGKITPALIPAAFSFLFHLGREILKDVEDIEGDKQDGASTVPIRWGVRKAVFLSTLIYVVLIALTPLPYLLHVYNFNYLIAVIIVVDVPILFLTLHSWKPDAHYGLVNNLLKLIMPLGLLSLFLGR